ncbi:hypothetical protein [Opitutus terrae]|uniref:hypothetical protein n=1 Tax=Opitutus terrae TaxID=107709 RepID=UPI0005D0EE98|nr:hypothetical protein [Opitutus terrae]
MNLDETGTDLAVDLVEPHSASLTNRAIVLDTRAAGKWIVLQSIDHNRRYTGAKETFGLFEVPTNQVSSW